MYVIITGSLSYGLGTLYGPFDCMEDAVAYADKFLSGWEWCVREAQDVRGDMQ